MDATRTIPERPSGGCGIDNTTVPLLVDEDNLFRFCPVQLKLKLKFQFFL